MKTNIYEYTQSSAQSQSLSPSGMDEISAIIPLFLLIMVMSMVTGSVKVLQKPETKEAAKEVAKKVGKAALTTAEEWAVRKVSRK